MSHVFVSYSRKDSAFVDQLIRDLESQNIEVWIDREDIRGGDRWRPAIVEAIRACRTFLLILSPNSVVSENVSKELSIAETHKRRIIPIAYQPCEIPAAMEYQLAELQWVDFATNKYPTALQQLTRVLSQTPDTVRPRPEGPTPSSVQDKPSLRWRTAALIAAALVAVGIAAYLIFRPNGSTGGSGGTPTPFPTATVATASPQANDRLAAIRLTAEGVDAFYDENKSRESVILFFNQAIRMDPTYAEAYFYRGQAYVALKKNDLAIADFKKALQLDLESDQRAATQEFLTGLQTPPVTTGGQGTGSTGEPRPSPTPATGATPGVTPTRRPPILLPRERPVISKAVTPAQVTDLFNTDKGTRIQATTRLIIDQKQNPEAVSMAIATARKQLDNKSGVINTLVYLENVSPAVLKSKREEVAGLLEAVRKTSPGPQTLDHVNKVQDALNKT